MSTTNKILVLVGIAIVVFGAIFLSRKGDSTTSTTATSTPTTTQAILVAKMTVEKFTHDDKYKSYTMDNTYPESSATEFPEISNAIKTAKDSFLKDYNDISEKDANMMQLSDRPYDFNVTTKVMKSAKTITYIIEIYTFEGGAHGGTGVSTFTYDASGKLVTLGDVFSQPFLPVVAPLARTYFYTKLGADAQKNMIDDGTEARAENYTAWYLTDNTVTFIFGQYQVGPYVLGIQEFPLAKSQIQDVLAPAYK